MLTALLFTTLSIDQSRIEEYKEYIEQNREKQIERISDELSALRNNDKINERAQKSERKKLIAEMRATKRKDYVPDLDLTNPGLIGTMSKKSRRYLYVIQVVDGENFIAEVRVTQYETYGSIGNIKLQPFEKSIGMLWVSMPTNGIQAERNYRFDGAFVSEGQKTYQSAIGPRTVPHVRRVSEADVSEILKYDIVSKSK